MSVITLLATCHILVNYCPPGLDLAQGFWAILIPQGLSGGALSHIGPEDGDGDTSMDGGEEGWNDEFTQWWFEFLSEKGGKGVSKDTWMMVCTASGPLV